MYKAAPHGAACFILAHKKGVNFGWNDRKKAKQMPDTPYAKVIKEFLRPTSGVA